MHNDIERILLTEEQIKEKVAELGKLLAEEYRDKNPVVVGVLKGVVIFYADMIRAMDIPCQMDFMCISSYSGTQTTGRTQIAKDLSCDINGRHVLILEDIFDTGNSLQFITNHLKNKGAASLKICTLLDKPERRKPGVTVKCDYTGFVIPNEFVVGYGLDFDEKYRNLPYIGILKPEAYQN
ncbi:MAG: hypoxanthine phosphoribosyltransferase [Oscillospiraceae bacterium]|nr:hypoxanthine phosphoribosyltransferase [Oscillospiraceae bacterium]